ncbi:MAG: hypothetical protein GX610_23120 [Rhodococcus sp.]|nr:hypothetical protein [Rhodococcus sp. (in: high G+C Gram-positive bacteria)]
MTSPLPLSTRLERLFQTMHKKADQPQTNESVATSASAMSGESITAGHLRDLRAGTVTETDTSVLVAIAAHFKVPAAYLTEPDCHDIDRQLKAVQAMRDAGVNWMALRGGGAEGLRGATSDDITSILSRLPREH